MFGEGCEGGADVVIVVEVGEGVAEADEYVRGAAEASGADVADAYVEFRPNAACVVDHARLEVDAEGEGAALAH